MLKCRQLCQVYRFYSYRFYSIDIFLYLFEVTCFRCNLQTFLNVFSLKIVIFKREYLETEIFSDYTVEEKNAPFFLNFSNISFFHMVVNYWTGGHMHFKNDVGVPTRVDQHLRNDIRGPDIWGRIVSFLNLLNFLYNNIKKTIALTLKSIYLFIV